MSENRSTLNGHRSGDGDDPSPGDVDKDFDMNNPPPDTFDVMRVREDFPILKSLIGNHPLVYLDNAATSQKPRVVIDTVTRYYESENANIHRGVHALSQRATDIYEESRAYVAGYLNAASEREIVFVRQATEAINLVASGFAWKHFKEGDNVILTELEHHANIVPWQLARDRVGIEIKVLPIFDDGSLDVEKLDALIDSRTRLVAFNHVSNALGTINPVKEMTAIAHSKGVPVLIDGAQAVPHMRVDVRDLDCEFYVFSGHKSFGPTGSGILYGKSDWLSKLPPYQGGGDMIRSVSFEQTKFKDIPERFEAGTPHIAGVAGLAAALKYMDALPLEQATQHEHDLLEYATDAVRGIQGLRIIGTAKQKASVLSFLLDCAHPHDIGTFLDSRGIAIRAGHHCAQPLMHRLGIPGTARASFAFYNTREEVDKLVERIRKIVQFFS